MRKFALAVALVALSTTGAFAKSSVITATLANPAKTKEVIEGSIIWRCKDTTCTTSNKVESFGASTCRALAKRAGAVTAFGNGEEKLDEAQLAACNGSAK